MSPSFRKPTRSRRSLLWLGCLAALLGLLPLPASAHEGAVRVDTVTAGPYTLQVELGQSPVRVDSPLAVRIEAQPLPGSAAEPVSVRARVEPGLGVDATPLPVRLTADPADPAAFTGQVSLPVQGPWVLVVQVAGGQGSGSATLPLTVSAPGAIPIWLGWLIGLSPLCGLLIFGLSQRVEPARLSAAALA